MRRSLALIASALAALMYSTLTHADDIQHGNLKVHDSWARATIGLSAIVILASTRGEDHAETRYARSAREALR